MKVIEKGKSKWTSRESCKGCHAVLEVDENDVTYKISDAHAYAQQYNLEIDGEYFVTCPECGEALKIKFIPPAIKDSIKNR